MSHNPRSENGNARKKLRNRLRAEGRGCWICRAFGRPDAIDYTLPARHPLSFEVDELVPVSKYQDGGYKSKSECALDYSNVDAVHRMCNQWRGNKSVEEVMRIAKGMSSSGRSMEKMRTAGYRDPTSREW